jgi:autotransporter-associated beta strand protein
VNSGSHTISAGVELAQSTTATVASGSRLLLSGALTGSASLIKQGSGKLEIDATGSFSGPTTVDAGLLTVNGSIANSEVVVASGGTLGGSGTVGGTTIENGGTLAPGNSPGTLSVSGDLTWASGGNYNWQIVNASGTAGSGWDLVDISGDLDLSFLSSASPFAINLWTLSSTGPDVNGAAINFNNQESYTWTIARVAGAIVGFNASYFSLNLGAANGTAGWANDLGGGSIAIVQNGQDLDLVFTAATPVPEPSTYGLLLGAGALALAAARRRRKA